jgi:site-specific recombinase XerD
MLEEDGFARPAAAQRLRSCVFGRHLDAFCAKLAETGYKRLTIRQKLWQVTGLARWMRRSRLALGHLDERSIERFVDARRQRGRTCLGFRATALLLLEHLRAAGVVRMAERARDDSPASALLSRYEGYLRRERGLTECTIAGYRRCVGAFVAERLDRKTPRPGSLCPGDVREFLLARVRRLDSRQAQQTGTALRSFLRFLFLRGEIETDLSLAVPTVRRWQLSGVPRHLSTRDVERLIRSCGGLSATGRRNRAILLLLARLGLRACEIRSLELGDLHWREGEIIVRGKGLVHDRLPLPPDVGEALAQYLRDRPRGGSRRVFICGRAPYRGFGHSSTVTTIVARALAQAGLAPPTRGAHLLRHSLATTMLRRGASLSEIGQVLRHRSANTTEIYAKVDFDALREVATPWPTARGAR